MAGSVHAKVTGLPELLQKLRALGATDAIEKIGYRGTFGAAKDIREAARTKAANALMPPPESGALLRAFAIKRIKDGTKRGYTVGLRAGRSRNKFSGEDAFYWTFLEFGFYNRAPLSFFRNAIAEQKDSALRNIITAGRKAVIDSGNRVLKKFGSGK